jgi:FtsP/CotA-like multicopper oxidase with cupredoxin domain
MFDSLSLAARLRALLLVAVFPMLAFAQTDAQVGDCAFDRPLQEPAVLSAFKGKLETTLTVRMVDDVEVPIWANIAPFGQPPVYQCSKTKLQLRQYSWRLFGAAITGFPGPTLKLRKASSRETNGDALSVKLVNELPVAPNDECNVGCDCSDPNNLPRCCVAEDQYPACFHGDNNTNLHFHGSHVSPQAPQDFVLLELRPKGGPTHPHGNDGTHGDHGTVVAGSYDYKLDPFRHTQPEGTHWYHPHKHGSTALQVGNGMAGALIIEGKFDDELRARFGGKLKEHLLVLQVIHPLNFTTNKQLAAQPLINGQPSPVIDMHPGEIRRLRIVAATVQADGAATIDFNSPENHPVEVRQIAMDGVQFAPANYARQPLLDSTGEVDLAPGNRGDFLVKAPGAAGTYDITYELRVQEAGVRRRTDGEADLKTVTEAIAPGSSEPRLFRIRVVPCPDGATCEPMSFPAVDAFPPLPDFLEDLPAEDVTRHRSLFFSMEDAAGHNLPPNQIPSQPSRFFINLAPHEERQFNPNCIDITNRLGETQQWTLWNTSRREPIRPLHIFHIHTNAFQVTNHPLKPRMNTPPYVWQDSVLLPDFTQGPITIRHKFTEFTGAYVLHCHFLGHEDRGMMLGVQVTCPDAAGKFGKPQIGTADDCRAPALTDAMPPCSYPLPGRSRAVRH